ncbi:hypothetical protein ACFY93_33690 [Streptomyces sp. NPDC008313]|uniref:hypothetical protein n=1 Tax=Streptomyces sp. NPDC008313 TaxID=3364826 RepID=UPI0036ED5C68
MPSAPPPLPPGPPNPATASWPAPVPAPPRGPADRRQAVAVALLNLGGLGLGYAFLRRWVLTAVCLAATGALLLVALPADPDGVSGAALVAYAVFVAAAVAHGALSGARAARPLRPANPVLVTAVALALLAVPAGGVVLYDDARDEATERMLLDRLEDADRLVEAGGKTSFDAAEDDFREALGVYGDLVDDHPGSRAAERVPGRLKTYYTTVGAPYAGQDYCGAVAPLKYLRTVPDTVGKKELGSLAAWPDDRLATSLYECAARGLDAGDAAWQGSFDDLLTLFPDSDQAAKVEPAVKQAVDKAVKDVRGDEPCEAVQHLDDLSSKVTGLPGEKAGIAGALGREAGRAGRSADAGAYDCGVDQYKDGDFDAAQTTMRDYAADNKHAKNTARAKKIAIAAEIAGTVPAAGKHLPTTASGGSISVTVKNDSPDDITVMYTGPVTGSFTLKACGSCKSYSLSTTLLSGFHACQDSGKHYPQRTISLPAGTTYFLHKPQGTGAATPASDTAKLRPGYIYTECAYTTGGLGLGD